MATTRVFGSLLPKLGRCLETNVAKKTQIVENVFAKEKGLQKLEYGDLFEQFGEIPAIRINAEKIAQLNEYSRAVILNIPSTKLRETSTSLITSATEASRSGWDYLSKIDRILENTSLLDVKKDKRVIDELNQMLKSLEVKFNKLKNGEFVSTSQLENELAQAETLALIPATSRGEVMSTVGRVRQAMKANRWLRSPSRNEELAESMKQEQLVSYLGEEYKINKAAGEYKHSEGFEDFLYQEYYLKRHSFGYGAGDTLKAINEYYGTKVFVPHKANADDVDDVLREFHAWNKAGGKNVNHERALTFDNYYPDFYNNNYVGEADRWKNFIKIRSDHFKICEHENNPVLRHEKMHLNNNQNFLRNPKYDFSKISSEKTWYRNEFKRAGISEQHIDYAYTNPEEFLSVAAEGDVTKYSDEFKNVLVELGMPDWFFNIRKFKSYNT